MRALFAGVVVLSMGTGACALIAGLGDYEGHAGDSDSSVTLVVKDGASASGDDGGDEPLNGDETTTPDDANESDVAPDSEWVITDDSSDAALSADVNTVCDKSTCPGCCKNGSCVGGQSVATCGTGGGLCTDCTSMGGACSGGSCTTKVADAAPPPTCSASKCKPCIPVYQSSCCKSDQTCGCKTNFGGNGSCN